MGKDVIRKENVKQYVHVPAEPKNAASNFVSQNLPLAAMFLKNKALAWACLFFGVQTYLNEPYIRDPADDSQPAYFRIFFSMIAILTTYIDLVFPHMGNPAAVGAKMAANEKTAQAATEIAETIATAVTSA